MFYWHNLWDEARISNVYRIKKRQIGWAFSLMVGDLLAVTLAFFAAYWISGYIDAVPTPDTKRITLLNCVFFGGLVLGVFHRKELYQWSCFIRMRSLLTRLPASLALSVGVYALIRLFVSPPHDLTYLPFLLLYCVVCFVLVMAIRLLVRFIDMGFLRNVRIERIAFVGWTPRLGEVLRGMAFEMKQFQKVVGFIVDDSHPDCRPPVESRYEEIGRLGDLETLLASQKLTMLLLDQSKVSRKDLQTIVDLCADGMVTLKMIPAAFDIWASRLSVRVFRGVPLIGINDLRHDRFENRILKRAVDIAGSIVGLVLSAPIIAVLAIMIRRESPGPVIFRQTRLGLRDKPFEILKLRSMKLDAEQTKGAVWAVENDPRRLKIGAFMRKWNLDELPQFWNVLKGEMTLVGPRPERPNFVEKFRDSVRYYNLRHSCKPGVTGWAAVHGLRGNTSLEDRLDYDLYYIENWSLMLDFKIMLMTLAPPKNAY